MASNAKNIAELLNNSANVPDAKITQSSVTQHVTQTDLTPVKQDIALVAFDAIQSDNRSALKLPNSFVDQYEDANSIATLTTCQRATDEKIAKVDGFISKTGETAEVRKATYEESLGWYAGITADMFG